MRQNEVGRSMSCKLGSTKLYNGDLKPLSRVCYLDTS